MNEYIVARISNLLNNPMIIPDIQQTKYKTESEAISAITQPDGDNLQYIVILKENVNPNTGSPEKTKIVYIRK